MKYSILVFSLLAIAQLFVPAQMIFQQQNIVNQGVMYKFKCAPRDPAHPLKGRFVRLRFDENEFTKDTAYEASQCYVSLKKDINGFAIINDITEEKPIGIDFLKVRTRRRFQRTNKVSINKGLPVDSFTYMIDYPFDQFFMEEHKAPIAEEVYREALRDSSARTYAVVRILNGEAVLEDVQINGVSLTNLAAKNQ